MTRGQVTFAAFACAAAAACVRLGIWQLDRLAARRASNASIAARGAAPALVLTGRGPTTDSVVQRHVRLRGALDYANERVWAPRSFEGVPGVAIVTPLRLADGSAVLVDRGWAPSPDARRIDLAATREADTVDVAGLALRAPRGPGDPDPGALVDLLPYPLAPFVVQWLPGDDPYSASRLPLRRWPEPTLGDGPHLMYAVQWFAFAAIAIGGGIAMLRQDRTASRKDVKEGRQGAA